MKDTYDILQRLKVMDVRLERIEIAILNIALALEDSRYKKGIYQKTADTLFEGFETCGGGGGYTAPCRHRKARYINGKNVCIVCDNETLTDEQKKKLRDW